MTRYARRGQEGCKLDEATPWSELRKKRNAGPKNAQFKDQRRENRRLKRKSGRESRRVCFNCRKEGHMMSDCPIMAETNQHGICFKCGSTEHSASTCTVRVPRDSYPFAQCFICGEKGHISKQCPDNPRGLYPKGGCCNECGSVEHFKRDCPEFLEKKGEARVEVFADVFEAGQSVDAEPTTSSQLSDEEYDIPKKKVKVVKF